MQYLQVTESTPLFLVAICLSAKGQDSKPEAVPPIILYFRTPALSCSFLEAQIGYGSTINYILFVFKESSLGLTRRQARNETKHDPCRSVFPF